MDQLWAGGPFYTDDPSFKITTDSVLLADFSGGEIFGRCMDLGCGAGLLSVLIHQDCPEAVYDSADLRAEAVEICRKNYRANDIRGSVLCGDVREHRTLGNAGQYDLVVCNPPYYYNGGVRPADPDRAAARGASLSPAQFSGAASYLLKKGGRLNVVHKPEFLTDIFAAMRLADIEPKQLRLVCHKADKAPSLVLISGRRSGRPGLSVLPSLILCRDDGSPTEEICRIYHMHGP